jgi:hypothetical protein
VDTVRDRRDGHGPASRQLSSRHEYGVQKVRGRPTDGAKSPEIHHPAQALVRVPQTIHDEHERARWYVVGRWLSPQPDERATEARSSRPERESARRPRQRSRAAEHSFDRCRRASETLPSTTLPSDTPRSAAGMALAPTLAEANDLRSATRRLRMHVVHTCESSHERTIYACKNGLLPYSSSTKFC